MKCSIKHAIMQCPTSALEKLQDSDLTRAFGDEAISISLYLVFHFTNRGQSFLQSDARAAQKPCL